VPHLGKGASLSEALADAWPSYLSFVISFLVIGIMWMNHHDMFKDIEHVDHLLQVANLLLLLTICFIPFPTAVLAESLRASDGLLTATLFLGGVFTVNAICFNLLWLRAYFHRELIDEHVSEARLQRRTRRYRFGPLMYGLTLPLALISPWISIVLYLAYAALYMLPAGD
jgi:uncharacterized membrane protein